MNFLETSLPDVWIVEPKIFGDDRGFFMETYHAGVFSQHGISAAFVQDNHSRSVRNVLRGLHYQEPNPQGKLVRAIRGVIWDVAVDIRPASPDFGRWFGTELSEENKRQLWVPPGFAHGFCVLSEVADVAYKCTELYEGKSDRGIAWDDPAVGIEWPVRNPILSKKDAALPTLREAFAGALIPDVERR